MRCATIAKATSMCAVIVLGVGTAAQAATTVTFKSQHEATIKICVYASTDLVQAVPMKTWEINPGKSVEWSGAPSSFHVKVFKPQLVDALLGSKNKVAYNTTVTIKSDNSIAVANKRSLTFKNSSGKQLKFAVYNSGDKTMAIPLKTWTIDNGKSATWKEAPAKVNLKLFEPALFDKHVATKTGVLDRKTVTASKKSGNYQVQVQ